MTVQDLLAELVRLPPHLPVIVHYDGSYEAPIEELRVANERERRLSTLKGEHVIIQVYT